MSRPSAREWADYFAGRLDARARVRLERAAASDDDVRQERDRIERIRAAMDGIAEQSAPELRWDQIGAQIHWRVSMDRRRPAKSAARRWALVGGSGLGVALGVAALWTAMATDARDDELASAPAETSATLAVEEERTPPPLFGLITMVQGEAVVDGASIEQEQLDDALLAGQELATSGGRVAVQFGERAGFSLGPSSSAVLQRFDEDVVELRVRGRIDVDLAPRRSGQRFLVVSDGVEVEVRGTRFQVDAGDEGVAVTCARGEVVVRRGSHTDSVLAGQRLRAHTADGPAELRPLADDELSTVDASLAVPMLPQWHDWNGRARHPSAVIVARDQVGRQVAVNGVAVGEAPLLWRVAPGRHHVAFASGEAWTSGRWLQVEAAERHLAESDSPPARTAAELGRRRGRVIARLRRSRAIESCVRGLRKRGLAAGAYAVIELGLAADGTHRFVNVTRSDLPQPVRRCIRAAVDRMDFGRGEAVDLRHRVEF